jgi:hypothetical protein
MVPTEWPIAVPATDRSVEPARRAGRDRLATVRRDFFLDPALRLSEEERALMTAMLHRLVTEIADELLAALDRVVANDEVDPTLVEDLSRSGLLDIPELIALLLRRAEEEQFRNRATGQVGRADGRLLQKLVSHENASVAAAAMALILSRGRRQDRFNQSRLDLDDVPSAALEQLVHAVAAGLALRHGAATHERLVAASANVVARHDSRRSLGATLQVLVASLQESRGLDDAFIFAAADEGDFALLAHALALRAGLGVDRVTDVLGSRDGERMMHVFRLAGITRGCAAQLLASFGEALGIDDPARTIACFDEATDAQLDEAKESLNLPASYLAAIQGLERHGQRTV